MKIRLSAVLAATLATASLAKVNELHAKMEQQGWKFADLQIHSENSDTKGVLVTYTK